MLKQHANIIARFLWFSDMVTTASAFFIAYWLRSDYIKRLELARLAPLDRYLWFLLAVLVVWTLMLRQYGAYRSYRRVSIFAEIATVWKAVLIGSLLLGTVIFVFKFQFVSRTLVMMFTILNLLLLAIDRFVIRMIAWTARRKGYNYRNAIIVGTKDAARDLAGRIAHYQHWGMRIIGFVSEGDADGLTTLDGHPVLGDLSRLESIVQDRNVDEVFFAVTGKRIEELEDALLMLEENGIISRVVTNIFPHMIAKVQIEELDTVPLLTFTTVPTNVLALYIKRMSDIIISLFLLLLSSPVMLAAAIVIKVTSPGTVLFSQKRCGLHGRFFTLYKFRSMERDAEARKKDLEMYNEMDGPVFKIKDDPRITSFGRFMRKTSIDELPQLWNVLKGDMSMVGPRPPVPEEVEKYQRWQRRRLSMRPGITCLWQISGRNEIRDFDEWVRLDLQYIDTWSLALDLKIFLKTILVVLLQKGAA